MLASELRQLSPTEIEGKIKQWKDELFRSRFKSENQEMKDTSQLRKLRRSIARGNCVLTELAKSGAQPSKAPVEDKKEAKQS